MEDCTLLQITQLIQEDYLLHIHESFQITHFQYLQSLQEFLFSDMIFHVKDFIHRNMFHLYFINLKKDILYLDIELESF